jgi:hypothetical protein
MHSQQIEIKTFLERAPQIECATWSCAPKVFEKQNSVYEFFMPFQLH